MIIIKRACAIALLLAMVLSGTACKGKDKGEDMWLQAEAVATLAADWVRAHTAITVQIYTFDCPRVGFEFFATTVTTRLKNTYRAYHETDPVTMVPVYPFSHAPTPGHGYYVPSSEVVLSGTRPQNGHLH